MGSTQSAKLAIAGAVFVNTGLVGTSCTNKFEGEQAGARLEGDAWESKLDNCVVTAGEAQVREGQEGENPAGGEVRLQPGHGARSPRWPNLEIPMLREACRGEDGPGIGERMQRSRSVEGVLQVSAPDLVRASLGSHGPLPSSWPTAQGCGGGDPAVQGDGGARRRAGCGDAEVESGVSGGSRQREDDVLHACGISITDGSGADVKNSGTQASQEPGERAAGVRGVGGTELDPGGCTPGVIGMTMPERAQIEGRARELDA